MVALHVGYAPFGATTPDYELEHVSEIRDGGLGRNLRSGTWVSRRG